MSDGVEGREPAGFWLRAGAMALDGVVVVFSLFVTSLALGLFGAGALMQWAGVLVPLSYHTLCLAVWGQTVGKRAAGARVYALDGSDLTPGRALARTLGYAVDAMTLGAGFGLAAVSSRKRALHDRLAGSVVVLEGEAGPARRKAVSAFGAVACMMILYVLWTASTSPIPPP